MIRMFLECWGRQLRTYCRRFRLVPKAAVASALEALAAAGLAPTLLATAADPTVLVPFGGPGPVQHVSAMRCTSWRL